MLRANSEGRSRLIAASSMISTPEILAFAAKGRFDLRNGNPRTCRPHWRLPWPSVHSDHKRRSGIHLAQEQQTELDRATSAILGQAQTFVRGQHQVREKTSEVV